MTKTKESVSHIKAEEESSVGRTPPVDELDGRQSRLCRFYQIAMRNQ